MMSEDQGRPRFFVKQSLIAGGSAAWPPIALRFQLEIHHPPVQAFAEIIGDPALLDNRWSGSEVDTRL